MRKWRKFVDSPADSQAFFAIFICESWCYATKIFHFSPVGLYTRVFKDLALSLYIGGCGSGGVYTTAVSDCRSSSLCWQGI